VKLKVGQTLQSAVDTTGVVVVRAPQADVTLTCAGVEMIDPQTEVAPERTPDPAHMKGALLGKRYTDDDRTIELLCIKAGDGSLALDGQQLLVMQAKRLPSSD
jgi:hypothetical protein